MEADLNTTPLLFVSLKSIHQVAQVSSFSKTALKLDEGGGGGDKYSRGSVSPVT
jgi:hypothetical protein